jgi:type IV fimbrial biogenesis protein FimT
MKPSARGFTIIELVVVIAITAIMASLVAPSFKSYLARKRVEGTMSELATDLQYARSEAVSRNAAVRVTLGANCYVIHTSVGTTSCTQTTKTIGTGATEIKTVQLLTGAAVSLSGDSSLNYIEFDPVRGIATFSTGGTSGTVSVTSGDNTAQLKACVTTVGRVYVYTTTSMAGYNATTSSLCT